MKFIPSDGSFDDIISEVDELDYNTPELDNARETAIKNAAIRKKKSEIQVINSLYKTKKDFVKSRQSTFTTSKFIFYLIFINCVVLEIYAMVAMYRLNDLSALSVLITAVIGESISFLIYSVKAYFAKRSEENMKFAKEKFKAEMGIQEDSGEEEFVEDDSMMDMNSRVD